MKANSISPSSMGQQDDKSESLIELYKLDEEEDEDAGHWRRLLDLEPPVWQSTKTFQMFRDALDLNSSSSPKVTNATKQPSSGESSEKGVRPTTTKQTSVATKKKPIQTTSFANETILSAEALKILADLPDLSHMSKRSLWRNSDKPA